MMTARDEAVRQALEVIAEKNAGRLTPQAVVKAAAVKDSPLHCYFEWDEKKAAAAHREDQARALIRSVKITVSVDTRRISTVYYVRDPSASSDQQGYLSLPRVRKDEDVTRDVLIAEFQRVAVILRRARDLAAALGMADDVDAIQESVDLVLRKFDPPEGEAAHV